MKKKLLILWTLLFGIISYAQTTLVNFPFTNVPAGNGLNYDIVDPSYDGITIPYPSLTYGPSSVKYFNNNMLEFDKTSDYLTLSINTVGRSGLIVSFDGIAKLGLLSAWAYIYLEANTGPGSTFVQIGNAIQINGSINNYNIILPAASIKSDLKIRLRYSQGWWGNDIVRIDNLKVSAGAPKIAIFSANTNPNPNTEIPDNADAADLYKTVFSDLQTLLEPGESKTYRVRNFNGTNGSLLNVTNIEVEPASGTTANDFVINSSYPTGLGSVANSNSNPYGEITVKFVPQGEGVRRAIIKVYSNGTPSPYSFTVIGGGKSCDISNTSYVINTADNGDQTLPSDLGIGDFVGGNTTTNVPNGSLSAFYPRPTSGFNNLFTSASTSWYTKDVEKSKIFGGVGGIDISNLKNVSVEFNVAAFADSNANRDNTRGVTNTDYIILSVTDKDGNLFDVMQLNGSNNTDNSNRRKYQFNTSGKIYSKNYILPLTIGAAVSNSNDKTNTGYSGGAYARFKFNIPLQYSKDLTNFKFRIKAKANENAVWLIDDIRITSDNAIFKTWDGTKWTPTTSRPGQKEKAVFDGNYDFTASGQNGDLSVCECEVNVGKTLTIPANTTLTVQGNVINNGTAANFVVKTDANLIQKDPGAQNIGNITVERNVTDMNNISTKMDYVYWSSPVAGQNLKTFSPGTPAANILQYKESTDYFVTSYDGVFKPAKGYAIQAEGGLANGYSKDYKFTGVPNNGDYKIEITRSLNTGPTVHGYNLIGNPYPSNINFDQLFANNGTLIYKTVWFWTNNTFTSTQQGSGYVGNNYAVYNATGGNHAPMPVGVPYSTAPNGIIKVGQGFLVQKQNYGSDSLVFKNSYGASKDLRVSTSGTFYQKSSEGKNRFWLKLISPDDMVNTQLIGYIDGATDAFEMDYDAEAFGMSSNLFYSILEDKHLLIQGKSSQFSVDDRINLGANFFQNSNYTIELEQAEGIFANGQSIYLKDKLTGSITNLSQGSYTFEANKGVTNARFEIIYKPETVLVTDSKVKDAIVVYRDSDHFVVKAPKIIATVEVYDLSGKMITVLKANNNQVVLNAAFFTKGMYVLRIKTIDGEITNKKIVKQ